MVFPCLFLLSSPLPIGPAFCWLRVFFSFACVRVFTCQPSTTSQVVPGAGETAAMETERPRLARSRRSRASHPSESNQGKGTEISGEWVRVSASAGKSYKRMGFRGSRCCSPFRDWHPALAHCLQLPPPQTVPGWTSSCLPPPTSAEVPNGEGSLCLRVYTYLCFVPLFSRRKKAVPISHLLTITDWVAAF